MSRPCLVPDQLLHGQPARALHVAALDLAEVDRRVQAGADVVQDVGAQDPVLAGQRVDRHLGHRRAIGEIEERPAPPRPPVPLDLGRRVEARRRELHPRLIGRRHQRRGTRRAAPPIATSPSTNRTSLGLGLPALGRERPQPPGQRVAGGLHRHAVQVAARARRRRRGVGHLAGVGRGDPHRAPAAARTPPPPPGPPWCAAPAPSRCRRG